MFTHRKYDIRPADQFSAAAYPEVISELDQIARATTHTPIYYKREIIISFLKDHCINNEWMKTNPEMTRLLVSGSLPVAQLESLFESCRNHKQFQKGLEDHIRMAF
jgi:hypothetical protein